MKNLWMAAIAAACVAGSAHASVNITVIGASQWGASDATLGVAGYTIENFEDVHLTGGLQIARSGGVAGNFAATSELPATSIFDGATDDPYHYGGQPLRAFNQGAWDGVHGIINHPGPSFYGNPTDWYQDSVNWRDLTFLLPTGVTSVGFSLDQVERADQILINGNVVVPSLIGLVGPYTQTDVQAGVAFNARNAYLRFDSTEAITSLKIVSVSGDGYMVDHFAFNAPTGAVPEPGAWALMIAGFAGAGMALRRRRALA